MVVQNPAAMVSVQSFHTAVSCQDDEPLEPSSQSLQNSPGGNKSESLNDHETEKKWREDMVNIAVKHLGMGHEFGDTSDDAGSCTQSSR
jgi:hypothetical protein